MSSDYNPRILRKQIETRLSEEEFNNLIFDLEIPTSTLDTSRFSAKVTSVLTYLKNRGLVHELLEYLREERDDVPWGKREEEVRANAAWATPYAYKTNVENFLYEYLGDENHPVPFGGRQAELKQLTDWLDDSAAPQFGLITAQAGRGKSALLTKWQAQLQERDGLQIVFFPISIRFNTNLEDRIYRGLVSRLAQVYNEQLDLSTFRELYAWKAQFSDFLGRTPPDNQSLLLIVDGLDEAVTEPGPDFFPTHLGSNIKVMVSARYKSGDVNEAGWLNRLNWNKTHHATCFDLPPLTTDGIANVLQEMGNPLDRIVTEVDLLTELTRLSEGDPLLVRLYVEELLNYGEKVSLLTPEDLAGIEPGIKGYFDRWWQDQEKQWEAQKRNSFYEKQAVQTFFNLCAAALGPLTREDIGYLAPRELSARRLKQAVGEVERFIVGDGVEQGYVFSHPRLNQYFLEELYDHEKTELIQRFLNYGQLIVNHLNEGKLLPQQAPAYIIQHYGAHIDYADHKGLPIIEELYSLVSQGWLKAWEALEGTTTGFLQDVDRVWAMANKKRDIAIQVKCALCHSSISTISSQIPPPLLASLYENGELTAPQVMAYMQNSQNMYMTIEFIRAMAPILPTIYHRDIVSLAQSLSHPLAKSLALGVLLDFFSGSIHNEVLQMALKNTEFIQREDSRIYALLSMAMHLPREARATVVVMLQPELDSDPKKVGYYQALGGTDEKKKSTPFHTGRESCHIARTSD